jgi:hypothetical protein
VHLVATTVVRLVGPLAHGLLFRCGGRAGGSRRRSARAHPDGESGGAAGLHDTAADRSTVRGGRTQGQTGGGRWRIPRSGEHAMARARSRKCPGRPVENGLCRPSERG